jgi:hypothetical protein
MNQGTTYFADPGHRRAGEINTRDNVRGFYLSDHSTVTTWKCLAAGMVREAGSQANPRRTTRQTRLPALASTAPGDPRPRRPRSGPG